MKFQFRTKTNSNCTLLDAQALSPQRYWRAVGVRVSPVFRLRQQARLCSIALCSIACAVRSKA